MYGTDPEGHGTNTTTAKFTYRLHEHTWGPHLHCDQRIAEASSEDSIGQNMNKEHPNTEVPCPYIR